MSYVLSKEELSECLHSLRKALNNIDYNTLNNVAFFNQESLFLFYSTQECDNNYTIFNIMQIIEPYIPFALSQTTLDLFILASLAESEKEMELLENRFNISAKLDFINILKNVRCDDDWNYILDICENLRKNKNYTLQFHNESNNTSSISHI